MKISLIQHDIIWEDKTVNLRNLELLISPLLNNTDIIVLPEMFSTGFSMNPDRLCEPPGKETFTWMRSIAEKGNFGLCGSYIVCEKDRFYNRFVFVSPEEEVWKYDKRHLFSMAGEDSFFTPGKERLTFNFRGARITPYICYDLRFPVWSRNRNESDLIIYTANWPEKRRDVWNTLLKARAIENQCYVVGVNRTGTDGNGVKYWGESVIIHPYGDIIASAGPDKECVITGEISISALSEFRKKFPVLKDADDFTLHI
jgi:predicted amidohydrolase